MKKLILKTVIVAIVAIFSICLVFFGILSLTVPKLMGKLAGNLGFVRIEASYALQEYKKDKKTETLAIAVQKNYNAQLYKNAAIYGDILIQDNHFDSYCQTQTNSNLYNFTTKVFLQSITAESYFYIGNYERTFAIARNNYKETDGNNQVVDWLLGTTKIRENTEFYNKLEGIKKQINKKGGREVCLKLYKKV